ncbi:MAG: glycosyltransferase family 2 protein [Lentisphaerae bacterium]|nr:glycosyltransferase family 2 protein [Lentisphaerota bacterium]
MPINTHYSAPGTGRPTDWQGMISRCETCKLSIRVIESPSPSVCPFCRAVLHHKPCTPPTPVPLPPEENLEERRRFLYGKPPLWIVLTLGMIGTLLLTGAVYLQVTNLEHYWYAPAVNIYSVIVGMFIISRFIFAAFYIPPPKVGFHPAVSVVIPCMNEEKSIARSIARVYAGGYPSDLMEVLTINDGSTDNTLQEMLRAQALFPRLVVVDFEYNRGLSHGMACASMLARGDFIVYVDSDTFLMPDAIEKLVQGFIDPTVGGIAGHTDVENARVNLLTKMQDVRYFFSYKIMKASESIFGMVSCLPGCFSAYRRVCVLHVMEEWMKEKVFGVDGRFGDDRSLTNLVLRDYRILYDDEALATTIVPESWMQYTRQQARWMRSSIRGMINASTFIWRKHPVPALSWYAMMFLPVIEPWIILQALLIVPMVSGVITTSYIIGVTGITLVWSLYHLQKTGRTHWWAGFIFTLTYVFFFCWQIYYALFTLSSSKWGTRAQQ